MRKGGSPGCLSGWRMAPGAPRFGYGCLWPHGTIPPCGLCESVNGGILRTFSFIRMEDMNVETANPKDASKLPYWKKRHVYKSPSDEKSVGWVRPKVFRMDGDFRLENGRVLRDVVIEYETYGTLNADRSNAILLTHALSGDAHVAGWDVTAGEDYRPWRQNVPGWWDSLVGPGLPFDTERFFIICSNVLGSCYGTTGPASPNPDDGDRPYGAKFPMVTVGDWVNCQVRLVDHLGIGRLYAVVGGSLGGQQALEWSIAYPERVGKCIMLASGPKLPVQGLGFNHVAKSAIRQDWNFHNGAIYSGERCRNPLLGPDVPGCGGRDLRYYEIEDRHLKSLHIARMLAHITYLSASGMETKFGRRLQPIPVKDSAGKSEQERNKELAIHGYLNHQGESFVERFDANSYLYITRAMDYYDAAGKWGDGDLVKAFSRIKSNMLVASFSSDWLYSPEESKQFVTALMRNGIPVTSVMLQSNYGHDAFLVETSRVARILRAFLVSQSSYGKH